MAEQGRVVIITGGGGGIGRRYCAAFAQAGYRVVVADIRGSQAVASDLAAAGHEALASDAVGFITGAGHLGQRRPDLRLTARSPGAISRPGRAAGRRRPVSSTTGTSRPASWSVRRSIVDGMRQPSFVRHAS
jgi:NAD(P)-dependent dehydrogenase (short-subunit alcohol dehydrogenase family)